MDFASKLMERTGKGYLSYSAIKFAADGADEQDMKLFELYMKGKLYKESDALTFGSVYDKLLLEPESFTDEFHVVYDAEIVKEIGGAKPRSTKKYKEWYDEEKYNAEEQGKRVINEDMIQQAEDMIVRLDESEIVSPETGEVIPVRHFLSGQTQYEIVDWIEDIPVRGFLDVRGNGFITDSKTTRSLSGFKWDVGKRSYDIQAYIYTHVEAEPNFYWVAQGKTVPYTVAVYKASQRTLSMGEAKFWSAINNIMRWLDSPEKETSSFAIYKEI